MSLFCALWPSLHLNKCNCEHSGLIWLSVSSLCFLIVSVCPPTDLCHVTTGSSDLPSLQSPAIIPLVSFLIPQRRNDLTTSVWTADSLAALHHSWTLIFSCHLRETTKYPVFSARGNCFQKNHICPSPELLFYFSSQHFSLASSLCSYRNKPGPKSSDLWCSEYWLLVILIT